MFGLDVIKVAMVGGLILSVGGLGYAVFHGIQTAELHKIELQQAKLIAAAQHEQDQRSIDALQLKADLATVLAKQITELKDALHAAPVSHACLASPAGRAFSVWLRQPGGVSGATLNSPTKSLEMPTPTRGSGR
jgi:hypothetical protein